MTAPAPLPPRDKWTKRLWAAVVFVAAALELRGLLRRNKDDTLSEYTWSKTKTPAMVAAITGLVAWLVYHFSFGNGVPLSQWDAAFAGGGVALGLIAWLVRRGRQ